jgi:short-subunit dehydrogenase
MDFLKIKDYNKGSFMANATCSWTHRGTLVTGASSGIGAEFARQLARRACPLVITARRQERLENLKTELLNLGSPEVLVVSQDLTIAQGPENLIQRIREARFPLAGVVNNAGLGWYGPQAAMPELREEAILQVNLHSLVRLTRYALPLIEKEPRGLVLNVSSIASFMPLPSIALYAASKAFVTSWTLSVSREWKQSHPHILLHALCPGPTVSEFMQVAANDPGAHDRNRMSVSRVVRDCLKAVDRGQNLSIPGFKNKIISLAPRFLPLSFQTWLAGKIKLRSQAKN